VTSAPITGALPHGEVEVSVAGFTYELDARCFFQTHRQLLPRLIEKVVGPWQGRQAFDLFAGVGLFSLPLAQLYERVIAVEGDRVSGRYLQRNGRRLENAAIDYFHSAVDSWIESLPDGADRIVVDPPRTGLSTGIRRVLCERRAHRLTYVSCHAATLALDLRSLLQVYTLESLSLLDLFPQTGHMEVVAQLKT
jgi:23S rRNA (uracil1939-C5)-methyltransferase